MLKKYLTMIVVVVCQVVCFPQVSDRDQVKTRLLGYEGVSIINLISAPDKYHDVRIRTLGYFCCGPGEANLYLTKDNSDYCDLRNSVVVRFSGEVILDEHPVSLDKLWEKINGQYIDVIGVFDKKDRGGLSGDCAGAVKVEKLYLATRWYDGKRWLCKKR